VWTLSNLRSLNLSHNEIADVKVPRDAKLPLLEEVDLSFNRLTTLPQKIEHLTESATFRFLDVSSNDINEFPEKFHVQLNVRDLCVYLNQPGLTDLTTVRYRKNYGYQSYEMALITRTAEGVEVATLWMTNLGLKIGFQGNRGLETKLREYLGMGQDDNINKKWVKRLMEDRARESEQRAVEQQTRIQTAAEEKEDNAVVVGEQVGRSEKQKKSDEREAAKRVKDKAVQREQKARAKAKGMVE